MHYFADGTTSGPKTYSGDIGSKISGKDGLQRQNMNIGFEPVPGKIPENVAEELLHNHDLKQVYHLGLLTQIGYKAASQKLVNYFFNQPGTVTAARWVTTASNILLLYMQEEEPSDNLKQMVEIINNLYIPSLFNIKQNWHCSNGSRHLFDMIKLARDLFVPKHPDLFDVVKKTVRQNGFYAHPENVLLSMVHDDNDKIREEAIKIIEELRANDDDKQSGELRKFFVPKRINFEAKGYHELVNYADFTPDMICSPPILKDYSIDEIRNRNFKESYKMVPSNR